jgi:hypothetical protein
MPGNGAESWTLLGGDGQVVEPAERYLAACGQRTGRFAIGLPGSSELNVPNRQHHRLAARRDRVRK